MSLNSYGDLSSIAGASMSNIETNVGFVAPGGRGSGAGGAKSTTWAAAGVACCLERREANFPSLARSCLASNSAFFAMFGECRFALKLPRIGQAEQRSALYDWLVDTDTAAAAEPILHGRAPNMGDARRAASAIAEHPLVEQVFVYGSVARGEAVEGSDLDILVLLGEASSREHYKASSAVEHAARGSVAGFPLDVVVRQRFTFEHLAKNVTASFECVISADAVLLYQRMPVLPTSGQQDEEPENNFELAVSHLQRLSFMCAWLQSRTRVARHEKDDSCEPEWERTAYLEALKAAHLAIEVSLRCVLSASEGRALPKGHRIAEQIGQMGDTDERSSLEKAIAPLRHHDGSVSVWIPDHHTEQLPEVPPEIVFNDVLEFSNAAITCGRIAANTIKRYANGDRQALETVHYVRSELGLLERFLREDCCSDSRSEVKLTLFWRYLRRLLRRR